MAQITGYMCDVCDAFSTNREGWLKVVPYAENTNAGIDVCSNKCLVKLGQQRRQSSGEVDERLVEAGRKGGRRNSKYSDDLKLEVLTYAEQHSIKEALDKYGIPQGTFYRWKDQVAL